MLDFKNNIIDLDLFKRILKEVKNEPSLALTIIDSFSENQFKSKINLLDNINRLGILDKESEVVIFGCWYGSILVPALSNKVKKITGIDLDDMTIRIAKNRFFPNYKNVSWRTQDVFDKDQERHHNAKLFINTSCEHMLPMKEWPYWAELNSDAYVAFQSNNMDWIDGHINCVYSLEDFKTQLPDNCEVLYQEEIADTRGIRYMLIGKISKN